MILMLVMVSILTLMSGFKPCLFIWPRNYAVKTNFVQLSDQHRQISS